MSSDSIERLKQLGELVNNSAQHTHRQLQSIESSMLNLLISSVIALAFAISFSALLEILIYWVPASFLLMYLWTIRSLFAIKKPKVSDLKNSSDSLEKLGQAKTAFGFEWFFINVSSLINAVGVIYAITFIVLVLIFVGTIQIEQSISIIVPIVTSLLYLSSPLFIDKTTKFFTEGHYTQIIKKAALVEKPNAVKTGFILAGLIYPLLIFCFPIWALYETRSFYLPVTENSLFLLLVLLLQILAIALMVCYFSSLKAKKELANTLTNFADIDYQISNLLLEEEVEDDAVMRLETLYLTAKKYDVLINDYFKFVNYYYLHMNRTYLKNQ